MGALGALLSVALGSTTPAPPARANEASGLAPSMPWNLDYSADSCALRRVFGEGSNKAYLELRRFEPGLGLQVIVASNRMRAGTPATFRYRFDHGNPDWKNVELAPAMKLRDGFNGVIFHALSADLPQLETLKGPERATYLRMIDRHSLESQFAAQTDTFVVRGAFPGDIALKLGPMAGPLAALDKCVDELLTHWNIDVEAHKSLSRPAVPLDLPKASRMIDYPPAMLRQMMPGIVNIRLDIDANGGVAGCHIQLPLSDPIFEKSSCADIEHALDFAPALDKDGKPIASYYVTSVVFQIRQ